MAITTKFIPRRWYPRSGIRWTMDPGPRARTPAPSSAARLDPGDIVNKHLALVIMIRRTHQLAERIIQRGLAVDWEQLHAHVIEEFLTGKIAYSLEGGPSRHVKRSRKKAS